MDVRYSLCPNCDACPEVVIAGDSVLIGEEGNQVRLSTGEWNVLVAGVKDGSLQAAGPADEAAHDDGSGCECGCQCCA